MRQKKILPLFLMSSMALLAKESTIQAEPSHQQTHRISHIENERVKVWKTTIMPDQPLKMHRHDSPRVIVPLTNGHLEVIQQTGEKSELVFEEGKPIWLDKDLPGTLHADLNYSDDPIEVVVIEMKE